MLTLRIDTGQTFYPHHIAAKIAADLQSGDSDWTYTARNVGNYSVIDIHDEDGELIAQYSD